MTPRLIPLAVALVCGLSTAHANTTPLAANSGRKPVTEAQQLAYSIGYLNGQGSLEQMPDLDVETFLRGFRDAHARKQSLLSDEERTTAINRYRQQRMAQQEEELKALAATNATAGAAFLAENGVKEGVITTASGLQYKVLTAGRGRKPSATDLVKVNYEGSLIDGRVFDSSYARNEPAVLQLDAVMPGWTEVLQLMPIGSTYEVTIPAALAYGERGAGPIPPNSVLRFKIELLGIERPPRPAR